MRQKFQLLMALFGSPRSYLGLDIGTSALKVVELLDRRRTIEVAAYAEANVPNILINPAGNEQDAIRRVANVVTRMLDEAGVIGDAVVAALPSGIVFSTVLQLPDIPDEDLDRAVHFAARDVVPADLDDMVLGWSRLGAPPHMDGQDDTGVPDAAVPAATKAGTLLPIFITAAPKDVVNRYTTLMEILKLELVALEVETFPLVRSLLPTPSDSALIVDIGDQATTYHIIDRGTPRLSHTIDHGGGKITQAIADAMSVSLEEAHQLKVRHGLRDTAPAPALQAMQSAVAELVTQAQRLTGLYQDKSGRSIAKTILIGGGAKLGALAEGWTKAGGGSAKVGNPWRGLSYPKGVEAHLNESGPMFAVAVGLAQRGLAVPKSS